MLGPSQGGSILYYGVVMLTQTCFSDDTTTPSDASGA